jgi:hypothetical protein
MPGPVRRPSKQASGHGCPGVNISDLPKMSMTAFLNKKDLSVLNLSLFCLRTKHRHIAKEDIFIS